jgi:chitin synthase
MVFAWFALGNWYIAFEILTKSLGDPSFGLPWAKCALCFHDRSVPIARADLNIVLHYVYLALLVMCFLLAMGNRPQGSNKTFTFAVCFFAILTCYMTVRLFFGRAPP